jgi:hypothetical protein
MECIHKNNIPTKTQDLIISQKNAKGSKKVGKNITSKTTNKLKTARHYKNRLLTLQLL